MVKVERISIEQAKSVKRTLKPSPIIQEYTQLLKDLPIGEARKINSNTEKEKPQTIKNRILRLKTSLKMTDLQVKRVGNIVMFWLEPESRKVTEGKAKTSKESKGKD